MNAITSPSLTKAQRFVILAVTFGSILEWYEIHLYIFWAPVISHLFFSSETSSDKLFNTISLFAIGFLVRPIGGLFFGRLGDRIGRKKAFVLSILALTIPTFLIGALPVYEQVGILAPILLAILRILQTFPSGGELPGAFCYLYENADIRNRKFMTSFGAVGNQIGIAISAAESFALKAFLPEEIYMLWGWRISFFLGGCLGLIGLWLRYKLHETHLFQEMVIHHGIVKQSIWIVVKNQWRKIVKGIGFSFIDAVSFYLIAIIFPLYFTTILGLSESTIFFISIILLIASTIPLPIFGFLGDRYSVKKLMIGASLGTLLFTCLLYFMLDFQHPIFIAFAGGGFILCVTCITALLPFLLCALFPTSIRYTCMGLTFNLADGIIGGLSPLIAIGLLNTTNDSGSFFWLLFAACFISLISYSKIKEIHH